MRRLVIGGALVLSLLLAVAPVHADETSLADVPIRRLRFQESGKQITATASFSDVLDARLVAALDGGFATTVLVRAYVYRRDAVKPVAFAAATFRVVYDLWDETYFVEIADARGVRNLRRASRADALRDVTSLDRFPLAPLTAIPAGEQFAAAIVVEVNPVSGELLAEVRRWLGRRSGSDDSAGHSFFGSFVSFFVNPELREAERTLRFRSQYFFRVKP